jgi:hypothetical protein
LTGFVGEPGMNEELKVLLIILAVALPVGAIVGIYLRKKKPEWCKSALKSTLRLKWWFYALAALMFLVMAILMYLKDRPYHVAFFLLFVCLEVYAMIRSRHTRLTPEIEAQIDASDPTKLWPINFWKQPRNSETEKSKEL